MSCYHRGFLCNSQARESICGVDRDSGIPSKLHPSSEEQLGKIIALLGENSKGINELKTSMMEMRDLKMEISTWKPEVDQRVHDLEHTVLDLSERIDQVLDVVNPSSSPLMSRTHASLLRLRRRSRLQSGRTTSPRRPSRC